MYVHAKDVVKSPSQILTKPFESHIWIRPEGRGTFLESPSIKTFIENSVEEGTDSFVIDLEGCDGMDSTFMGMIAGLGMNFQRSGKASLIVVGASDKNLSSLKELGLHHIVEINPSKGDWVGRLEEVRTDLTKLDAKDETDKESHILKCHEDLCVADDSNLNRFKTVLDMLGSDLVIPSEDKPDRAR